MVVRSNWRESPQLPIRNPPLSITRAVLPSVCASSSRKISSSLWTSSSISCGSVAMILRDPCYHRSSVLGSSLADKFVQQHASNHVERFENAFATVGAGREGRDLDIAIVQEELHIFNRGDIGQIALVVLKHIGNFLKVQLQGFEIFFQVGEAFNVLGHFIVLRIGDVDDDIDAAEHELARWVV